MNQPDHDLDRRVAEALGYTVGTLVQPVDDCGDFIYENSKTGEYVSGTMNSTGLPVIGRAPVPPYSSSPADALAALEATGEPYSIDRDRFHDGRFDYIVRVGSTSETGTSFPSAACAAIIAWAEAKKGGTE